MNPFTPTVVEGRERWLAERKTRQLRSATLRSYLHHSNYLVKRFGSTRMGMVRPKIAQDWLLSLPLGNESKKDIRGVVDQIWRFNTGKPLFGKGCVRLYEDPKPIRFYTADQVGELLALSPDDMRGWFALGFFGGLRPTEIERLDPHTDITDEGVLVRGAASKTRQGRYVQPRTANLLPYLRAYGLGRVNLRRRRRALCDALGIDWIPDGPRHTFATHYCALYGPGETALVLGHRSLDMLYRHYKGVVSRSEAERYFRIRPCGFRLTWDRHE